MNEMQMKYYKGTYGEDVITDIQQKLEESGLVKTPYGDWMTGSEVTHDIEIIIRKKRRQL